MADLIYEKCPNCGKDFLILDKNTWRYGSGSRWKVTRWQNDT